MYRDACVFADDTFLFRELKGGINGSLRVGDRPWKCMTSSWVEVRQSIRNVILATKKKM